MSTDTQEREMELVAGTIGGITQKKADTWTVAVTPEGSNYAKNLWTKDADLKDSLAQKIGQHGAFVCGASYWERDGKQIRSLWIDALADGTENLPERVATPAAAPRTVTPGSAPKPQDAMTKDEWAAKDRAADLRACIAIAAGALQHTMPSQPTHEDLNAFVANTLVAARQFHGVVTAERTGEDFAPF